MARSVTLGNGNLLVGFDNKGLLRDLYYPYVGYANHVSGASGNHVHNIGIFVDGSFSWLGSDGWVVDIDSSDSCYVGTIIATHNKLGVRIESKDAVHNEQNVFIRSITVKNLTSKTRDVKVFFAQQFRIFESRRGDTAYYDPRINALIHYKGQVAILANAFCEGRPFNEYTVGLFGIEGKEGAFRDAEDGVLEMNSIEHGSVDSVLAVSKEISKDEDMSIHYWLACADTITGVHELDEYVIEEGPERLIAATNAYWSAWLHKEAYDLSFLNTAQKKLYHKSLLIMRNHTDNRGGIIASSDTDMLHHGRDTYSYVWPRDGALVASAFDIAGYRDVTQKYFSFIANCIEPGGYLMHKYGSDGTLGSSWHSWMFDGKPRLPIQEDETALTIVTLWEHYEKNRDIEFIESLYNSFIEPATQFMVEYIEPVTGLPYPSFDLWEEKYGVSTFTVGSVIAALDASSKFAQLLGKDQDARSYAAVARRMQDALFVYLYDEQEFYFYKQILLNGDGEVMETDKTIDSSSLYALFRFGLIDIDDKRLEKIFNKMSSVLHITADSKGYIRYEKDNYYYMEDAGMPNPWIITTLWIAQYHIATAKQITDLEPVSEILEWATSHAVDFGVLPEQVHPHTREHLSTAPLVWSHAEYVYTVNKYREKLELLSK